MLQAIIITLCLLSTYTTIEIFYEKSISDIKRGYTFIDIVSISVFCLLWGIYYLSH